MQKDHAVHRVQWLLTSSNEKEQEIGATASCTSTESLIVSSYDSNDSSIPPEEQDHRSEDMKKQGILRTMYYVGTTEPRGHAAEIRTSSTSSGQEQQEQRRRENCLMKSMISTPKCSRSLELMNLVLKEKDTCPDRLKMLHRIGTQALLLKRTQDYMKVLLESRRTIRFEMSLQKKREKLKFECAKRKGVNFSTTKPLELKKHVEKNIVHQEATASSTTTRRKNNQYHHHTTSRRTMTKDDNSGERKPFNAYAAFQSKVF